MSDYRLTKVILALTVVKSWHLKTNIRTRQVCMILTTSNSLESFPDPTVVAGFLVIL